MEEDLTTEEQIEKLEKENKDLVNKNRMLEEGQREIRLKEELKVQLKEFKKEKVQEFHATTTKGDVRLKGKSIIIDKSEGILSIKAVIDYEIGYDYKVYSRGETILPVRKTLRKLNFDHVIEYGIES